MKRIFVTISILLLISWLTVASFADTLNVDFFVMLQTDKTLYHPGEQVNVTGTVYFNGSLISELVAIQVNDINDSMVFRTVFSWPSSSPPTIDGDINGDGRVNILDAVIVALHFGAHAGDPNYDLNADINKDGKINILDMAIVAIHYGQGTTPSVWRIEVIDAYIGDLYGNPVGNVQRGSDYYVHVRYKNTQEVPVFALIAFSIFDVNGVPMFASYLIYGMIDPGGQPYSASVRWRVPTNAALGSAKVYGNAYSDFPQDNGYPHSPERSSTFNIVAGGMSSSFGFGETGFQTMEVPGYYYLTFRIPTIDPKIGTYTVFATSFHFTGQIALLASNITTFEVQP